MPGSYTLGTEWRAAVFLLCAPPHTQRTAPREWNNHTIIPETPGEQNGRGETGEPQLFSPPYHLLLASIYSSPTVHSLTHFCLVYSQMYL
ncbi:hypothetical protein DFH09DRAFT_1349591 [Mycena vulgaris]|nr:hypothetical protein DFH09DRAFT_1349591 [Mycena vulgaris]